MSNMAKDRLTGKNARQNITRARYNALALFLALGIPSLGLGICFGFPTQRLGVPYEQSQTCFSIFFKISHNFVHANPQICTCFKVKQIKHMGNVRLSLSYLTMWFFSHFNNVKPFIFNFFCLCVRFYAKTTVWSFFHCKITIHSNFKKITYLETRLHSTNIKKIKKWFSISFQNL